MSTVREVIKDARISDCGLYRYSLARTGFNDNPIANGYVNFIMLNPSTADSRVDDPTIRRCIAFCRSWGYDQLVVTNLYAFRATKPAELWRAVDPRGPENVAYVKHYAMDAALVVCAWGAHGLKGGRGREVSEALLSYRVRPHYLAITADGEPRHPLYLKNTLRPVAYVTAGWQDSKTDIQT